MAMKKSTRKRTLARSSKTGRFVSKKYAKSHPKTTTTERVSIGTNDTGPRIKRRK